MMGMTDRLARVVLARRELSDILHEVTEIARGALGADAASITLIRDAPFTAAHAGQLALDADEMQYKRGHGPCLDAGRTGTVLQVSDMRTETRWPEYAREVAARGVLGSLSVPLPFQGATIGAVNIYSSQAGRFLDAVSAAEEAAAFVAVAVGNADAYAEASALAVQMQEAMKSRAVIDMAKGILIAQRQCSPDEAFTILSRASQRSNRKLRDIAQALVVGAQNVDKATTQ
jgi:GAF domain-containing protein